MLFPIVTISRSLPTDAEDIGLMVAEELGFSYLDNKIIQRAAEKAGVSPEEVDRVEHTQPLLSRIYEVLAGC